MARVLVNCDRSEDLVALQDWVETTLRLDVSVARTDAEVERVLKRTTVHLLLRHSHQSVATDLNFARGLRRVGFAKPILMITDHLGEPGRLGDDPGVCLLEQPFERRALGDLVTKMLSNRPVPQQIARRFGVRLETTLETFVSGAKFSSQMFNISTGGAYLEMTEKPEVRVGDLVRMRVWLEELGRERVVSGRVVWLTGRGHAAGGFGLGLKFMRATDLYRRLSERGT